MSSPPHLVALVLQSKKALLHGEQLCSRARDAAHQSTHAALVLLAIEAQVRWLSEAVIEQLQIAASIATSIAQTRTQLDRRAKEWDTTRSGRVEALDTVLDALGTHPVPPDFHQAPAAATLFRAPRSDHEDGEASTTVPEPGSVQGNSATTVRRAQWRTLRDFVDERAIEDALEVMDADRTQLDNILDASDSDAAALHAHIATIRAALPPEPDPPTLMNDILHAQDAASATLAQHLESLAAHYDGMAAALREHEGEGDGEGDGAPAFGPDDLLAMNRDTEELPVILAELEADAESIVTRHQQLMDHTASAQASLEGHHALLDDLDELGEIMSSMLEQQRTVELSFSDHLTLLNAHLDQFEMLFARYTAYQVAYAHLLVEMARRRRYADSAERVVGGMMAQLDAMSVEEGRLREEFYAAYGNYMPYDLCLSIQNPPTKWTIGPVSDSAGENQSADNGGTKDDTAREGAGGGREVLPDVPEDLVVDAQATIAAAQGAGDGLFGSASL